MTPTMLALSGAYDYPRRMIQLALDLPQLTAFGRSDFLVSDSNAAAIERIDRWPDWPSGALVLYGPAGCGKTHLAHLWRERVSGLILSGETLTEASLQDLLMDGSHRIAVDDAERAPEHALLHLYNSCRERRGSVLITGRRPPGSWEVELGDLRSRLRAVPAVAIEAPDDALLGAVFVKHFADRQLRVAPDVLIYLIRRMERSLSAAKQVAADLDAAALTNQGPVTIPLARKVLANLSSQPQGDQPRGDQALSSRNDSAVT